MHALQFSTFAGGLASLNSWQAVHADHLLARDLHEVLCCVQMQLLQDIAGGQAQHWRLWCMHQCMRAGFWGCRVLEETGEHREQELTVHAEAAALMAAVSTCNAATASLTTRLRVTWQPALRRSSALC